MSEELKKLIDENHGERTFYDGELVGAFFTVKNLENLCLAYACDKLSVKDREIMRLREALVKAMEDEAGWFDLAKQALNQINKLKGEEYE